MTTMIGISLTGRPVLLVGGGSVTARRARRLISEGALVRIVAPEITADVASLVREHDLEWTPRAARRSDVKKVWLVHTATGNHQADAEVAAWAESRRILCINAGNGDHGTARLAAATQSGDVIVGVVSDSGIDPRRTATLRNAIAALLHEGKLPLRRRRATTVGQVHLVGGGPGPVDLITVRGRRLLAEADVVVTDRLGPLEVLEELDPGVEIIDVGKQPDHHPVPQEEINRIIVERAQAGLRVVRLKGGDPFVYGRGGEEVTACLAAGVSVEVVPGLTSIVSVPQAAGIPITHRGVAASVHIVNGQAETSPSTLAALADETVTTVVLMGVKALPRMVSAALDAGVPADRPLAIIESGHTLQQRTTRTTLGAAVVDAAAVGVQNPAVIVIGNVADAALLLPDHVREAEVTR